MPSGRTTEDVDLIINVSNAPAGVKDKLLSLYSAKFEQRAQFFYYKAPTGKLIQIDICAAWQSPYLPSACKVVNEIANGVVPYISATDLIAFKISSCGLRAEVPKGRRDANDAEALLRQESRSRPLVLTPEQKSAVEAGLPDVMKYSNSEEKWWKKSLGL